MGEESREGETEGSLEMIQDEFGRVRGGRSVTLNPKEIVSFRKTSGIWVDTRLTGISLQRVIPVSRK